MAKKKTTLEPQDEQVQEPNVPMEDMPADSPDGESSPEPSNDFPTGEENPFPAFEEPSDPQDDFHTETDDEDVLGEPDAEPAAEDAGEDYGAFLQAVAESDGLEPVPLAEPDPLLLSNTDGGDDSLPPVPESEPDEPARIADRQPVFRRERERVLTIDPHAEVQTREDLEDIVWHELQNAERTRHALTGTLDSVERTDNGMTVAIVRYKGFKVMIPLKEMMVHTGQVPGGPEFYVWVDQVTRILHARLGSDIDFVVRGVDNESRMVAGSRRDAMLRKRKRFYLDTDEMGNHIIEEGRIVQARVVAVAEKVIRVEVFGVECNIAARGFSSRWIGSARDDYYVGQLILVRVKKIERVNVNRIRIEVDMRSLHEDAWESLSQCQPQCRYVGQVTDTRKGVVYVRLNNGANAIAHTCYDMRMPGKKDVVSFSVTRLDERKGIAIGIITRIIKQNL